MLRSLVRKCKCGSLCDELTSMSLAHSEEAHGEELSCVTQGETKPQSDHHCL